MSSSSGMGRNVARKEEEEDDTNTEIRKVNLPGKKAVVPGGDDSDDDDSRSFWSIAWEAHVYFSGTLFVLLAAYCTVNILRLHTFSRHEIDFIVLYNLY